jgi:hypothetical protein
MEYRQIISVTGLGGLFQLVSNKNDGAIVKSLTDDSVKFISARVHHITPLESIEIYTYEGNVRLHEVFEMMKENDESVADLNNRKDNHAAKAYFKTILPNFDEERVYASDIRKVLKWYAILKDRDLLHFEYLKEQAGPAAEEAPEAAVEKKDTAPDTKAKKKGSEKEPGTGPAKKKPVKKEKEQEANDAAKPAKKPATAKKKESAETGK